jgi:hypothetical protein
MTKEKDSGGCLGLFVMVVIVGLIGKTCFSDKKESNYDDYNLSAPSYTTFPYNNDTSIVKKEEEKPSKSKKRKRKTKRNSSSDDSYSPSTYSGSGGGRCNGSRYCSACKNCSRCKHCKWGGTCGVCR